MKNKIHPTSIIAGYRLAMREAVKYIKVCMCMCFAIWKVHREQKS